MSLASQRARPRRRPRPFTALRILIAGIDGQRLIAVWCPKGRSLKQFRLPNRLKPNNLYPLNPYLVLSNDEQFHALDVERLSHLNTWKVPGANHTLPPLIHGGICYTVGEELNLRRVSDFQCIGKLKLSYGVPDAWRIDPNGKLLLKYGGDLVECVREGFLRLVSDEDG